LPAVSEAKAPLTVHAPHVEVGADDVATAFGRVRALHRSIEEIKGRKAFVVGDRHVGIGARKKVARGADVADVKRAMEGRVPRLVVLEVDGEGGVAHEDLEELVRLWGVAPRREVEHTAVSSASRGDSYVLPSGSRSLGSALGTNPLSVHERPPELLCRAPFAEGAAPSSSWRNALTLPW
jgi:hypothetical protein